MAAAAMAAAATAAALISAADTAAEPDMVASVVPMGLPLSARLSRLRLPVLWLLLRLRTATIRLLRRLPDTGVDPTYYGDESGAVPSYGYLPPVTPSAPVAAPDPTAHVTVRVPADAEIWFGKTKTTSTGSVREFETPELTPGRHYSYQIRARWNEGGHPVTNTQTVDVTAGSHASVIFLGQPNAAGQASQ